jgi:para-aminobenzoate synthetase/4-amino-4-deoxychorismate lyase
VKVVLKHGGRWLHFQCPEKILKAERVEEVLPMLREAEASNLHVAGFISYEAAPAFDSALKVREPAGFPLMCFGLFPPPHVLDSIEEVPDGSFELGELEHSVTRDEFVDAIAEIKERIAEGATYQVNYTYRLNADFSGNPWTFFHALVSAQKTDHAAFIEFDNCAICSVSPELFFSFNHGTITSRPMKGTARRGRTFTEDWAQAEALQNSEKDRAENIMIVDMIRNDIGRVARPGSVETVSKYDVEKYPTVWQMTSTVTGILPKNSLSPRAPLEDTESTETIPLCSSVPSVVKILKALFPCASITGAPKAKTMEIIQSLETTPRKIYTGSIGFITPMGEACFNVAIRTALIQSGRMEFGVGGGIVWDSDPEEEYEETLTKARVLTQPRPEFQLLETMLWEPESGIFLLDEHLQRLGKSAAYFDVPLDVHEVLQSLDHLGDDSLKVRLLVSRDGGYQVQTHRFPAESRLSDPTPLMAMIAKEPVDSQDIFLFHKTTHREVYEKAKADFPDCDDVILWNERGEVTESAICNIVIRKGGVLITPPVECSLLAGTFREYLLNTRQVKEGIITLEDLLAAEEVFLVNSVRKWQKAVVERQERDA